MAKGVKRIKWTGQGRVIGKLSVANVKATIPADEDVFFDVDLWHEGTSEAEKKKPLTWILQDYKTRTVIVQKMHVAGVPQKISIPKPLCGPFEYYIEASLLGTRDLINKTGLKVRGECPPKIVSSKWCTTNDGADVRKSHSFKYGETIYLNLMTEGLNGHLNLSVDIFRHLDYKTDPILHRYTSVDVIDGEINLEIKNTYAWFGKLKPIKENEEFYVKIFDPVQKTYITDDKNDTEHGRFLRIEKKIASQEIKVPKNLSPLKTGKPDESKERFDFCKFETIGITEINKAHTIVFDKGVKLINEQNPKTTILKTILFDFEQSVVTPQARTTISNVLQYLLGTRYSRITIDGHACVIGKEQYNQKLSQQRSDAVKKAFTDGGLAADRIIAIGHGEVNPTDDKKGRDNIKHKDEKEYKENRRVDIMFETYGHDAQTIVFETIAHSMIKNN
jgi:outer membrane protein OmpA-like peptidoglycan-associated protein